MKKYNGTSRILAIGALLVAGSVQLQALPNLIVAEFATGTQGENNTQDGTYGQWTGDNLSIPYGSGTIWWDGTHFAPGLNDSGSTNSGSAYMTANFSSTNNTDLIASISPGYNNWYYEASCGVPGWTTSGTVDGTQYSAVQFDILWDTNSILTIPQFNTGDGWPVSDFRNPAVGPDYMGTNSYYPNGVEIYFFSGSGGADTYVGTFQVPEAAASGWQTVTVPYSPAIPGISSVAGLWFGGYFGGGGELVGVSNYSGSFWIDNLILVAPVVPTPPPTMSPPVPAKAGLAVFNATEDNAYYDRNQVVANTTSGLSWIPNGGTYSLTLTGFPANDTYSCEAYLMFIPNSTANANGEDYNQSNALILVIQSAPSGGGQAFFNYKLNEPNGESLTTLPFQTYTGGPNPPGSQGIVVPTTQLLGTYTVTFTGPDTGTVTMPDGTTGHFNAGAGTFDTAFTENPSSAYPFLIYMGGQANSAGAIDQSVVYGSFSSSFTSLNENFVADANNPANLPATLQNWSASTTHYAPGVVLVPSSALYWVGWTLPASGFSLIDTANLAAPNWQNVSTYSSIAMYGKAQQLVAPADLQSPANSQFFALVQRSFSQLLVLLPGQTLTPGTAPGYSGTPTPVGLNSDAGLENFTVYAVDSNFNPVPGITDTIAVSTTDGTAITPNPEAMSNGSAAFTIEFGQTGSFTITATDQTNPGIASGTSAPVMVNNN